MCQFRDSTQSAACFVPLLGANIDFIILLSCQHNREGVWGPRLPCLVTVQSFLNDNSNPVWFPYKCVEIVLCFCSLNCAKQTNKNIPSYLFNFILKTSISIKST